MTQLVVDRAETKHLCHILVNPALLYYISLTSWKEMHPLKAERYLGRLCTSEKRNLLKANSRNSMDDTNTHVDPTVDLKISLDLGITIYRKYRLTSYICRM